MTKQQISQWLGAAHTLPPMEQVQAASQKWPWFLPLKVMEAAYKDPTSSDPMQFIRLYGIDYVTGYQLLHSARTEAGPEQFDVLTNTVPTNFSDVPFPEGEEEASDAYGNNFVQEPHVKRERPVFEPLFSEDYFLHQGILTSNTPLPEPAVPEQKEDPKTLMVMMSFADWLAHFKIKSEKEQQEERDKRALRSMWQQEKLASVLEEETDEIPEDVFEMAVNSLTRKDNLVSESLARILEKQEKWEAASDMYRKLGLLNPSKSSYFASRAEAAKKRLP